MSNNESSVYMTIFNVKYDNKTRYIDSRKDRFFLLTDRENNRTVSIGSIPKILRLCLFNVTAITNRAQTKTE